jgi:outer membrane receptor for ferrienterochelin and colicins
MPADRARLGRAVALLALTLGGVAPREGRSEDTEVFSEKTDRFTDMSLEELLSARVVSASLLAEDQWVALSVISVITKEKQEEYGHLSIGDALRYEPGFYPVYDLVNYNVGVRGVNGGMGAQSQVVRTMLEGRDIRFRPTGGTFFGPELMPRLGIRQVELVRGPVSALYGADAFLGAVNVIPNRAADMGPGFARAEVNTIGQQGRWGVQADGAVWGTPLGLDTVVSMTVRELDRGGLHLPRSSPSYPVLAEGLGSDATTVDLERALSGLARTEKSWGGATIVADANLQYFERNANFTYESSPLADATVSLYNAGSTLRYNQEIGERIRLVGFAAYGRGGPTEQEQLVDRQVESTVSEVQRVLDYKSLESRVEMTYAAEVLGAPIDYSVTAGGDYVYDDEDLPAVIGIREGQEPLQISPPSREQSFRNGGGFAQLRLHMFERLRFLGGVRLENQSLYGSQASYRTGVGYADRKLSVKALYGRSFKAPSVSLLYAQPVVNGGPEQNPELQAQYAQTGELNVAFRPASLVNLSVTGFVSKIDAFAQIDTEGFVPRPENSGDIDTVGGEAELRFDHQGASGFDGFANVAYAHTRQTQDGAATQLALYPDLTVSNGVQYHLERPGLRFLLLNRLVSPRRADPSNVVRNGYAEYSVPLYDILSAGVYSEGLSLAPERETTIGVRYDNLLFQNYVEPGFLGIDIPGEPGGLRVTLSQEF